MTVRRRGILSAVFAGALSACSGLTPPGSLSTPAGALPSAAKAPAVEVREHLSGRFIALIGPKVQHAPAYLDIAGTNFYCLRSFIDRKTGESADQLYVADSYDGAKRDWIGAHDGAGQSLLFIPISRHQISCEGGCSYADEFAANIPESELRTNPKGLAVTFTDRAGDQKTITVSADQIAEQLAALDAQRSALLAPAVSTEPPPAHQP
jgi:hypothetical protein